MGRRRLADGLDGWCDPLTGEVVLAEGLTPAQEADVLRQMCARLLGDPAGSPDARTMTREQAVRPDLYVVPDQAHVPDQECAG